MMRRRLSFPLSLFLPALAFVAACGDESAPRVATPETVRFASGAIQGGYADAADKSVFGIYRLQGGQPVAACSGSLIAPNAVLTARHCVADIVGSASDCTTATFSAPFAANTFVVFNDQTVSSQTFFYQVAQVRVPSDPTLCGRDLAILILAQSVNAAAATPLEPRVNEQPHYGEAYSAIGYGNTCGTCADGGRARNRRDALNVACLDGCGQPPQYATVGEWWGGDGVCSGDSGGPAFDSQGRVIGVASRAAVSGNTCVQGIYERLDSESAFVIQSVIDAASAGGYAPPGWTSYDGGAGGSTQTCSDCQNGSLVPGASCNSAWTGCTNNADCVAFLNCANACTTNACYVGCYQQQPAGVIAYGSVEDCLCQSACPQTCAAECAVAPCGFGITAAACNTCFQQNCCAQGEACAKSHACYGLIVCAGACTTQACLDACNAGYAGGVALSAAMYQCIDGPCGTACGVGGSGGTGGSAGTGGVGGSVGTGGSAGTGGVGGGGGSAGTGGMGGSTGGSGAMGGAGGAGGATGGAGGSGPAGSGGSTGGVGGSGPAGSGGLGQDAGPTGGVGGSQPPTSQPTDLQVQDNSGCGCRTVSSNPKDTVALLGFLAVLGLASARRRKS